MSFNVMTHHNYERQTFLQINKPVALERNEFLCYDTSAPFSTRAKWSFPLLFCFFFKWDIFIGKRPSASLTMIIYTEHTSGRVRLVWQRLWYILSCLWTMHIKETLLLTEKSNSCDGSGFPLSLSGTLPYVWRCITVNKMCASLNKTFPSFLPFSGSR